jgi:hypothetical protein
VLLDTRLPPERDELAAHAVDQGQGARQLERVAFTSTEQSVVAEGCRGDVEDPHARLPSDPRMSRAAQRRYLYHCRLAELAGDHDAEVEFMPVRLWP